jgi:hypothetical protein
VGGEAGGREQGRGSDTGKSHASLKWEILPIEYTRWGCVKIHKYSPRRHIAAVSIAGVFTVSRI